MLPVKAAPWVRAQGLPGRLFNEYRYGGYLAWESSKPDAHPLFVDALNAYGPGVLREYLQIRRAGPRARALLDGWEINTCVLPDPSITPLRRGG